MMLFFIVSIVSAVNLTLESQTTLYSGVVITHYRASSPNTDVTVAEINLCQSDIHVNATEFSDAGRSAGSWGSQQDTQIAINADFYKGSPLRVYGDAVGNGVPWPLVNTGLDAGYSWEWYYHDFGWIAFGHDWVDYTYTKWVKDNASQFPPLGGWQTTQIPPEAPNGTIALVSGFPALVIEGQVYTCSSPTDSSCFPDRADMRARHPRSAVGLSEDRETLYLVAVDGRTSSNSGMYGAELAETMGLLGAYFALNLDGGGSTQLWSDSDGYLNSPSETYRSVANHLGVFAGGSSSLPSRPGHCQSSAPCQSIPPEGGIIDNDSACFQPFGPAEYWRTENVGYNGTLRWTNAYTGSTPVNWTWWQFYFEEEGDYLIEWYATPNYAIYDSTSHHIVADGTLYEEIVDQSNQNGWTSLGTYHFAAGGLQHVSLSDIGNSSTPSGQKIVADAFRLTRVGDWCGDGNCTQDEDCFSCVEDCPPVSEIEGNGIDDDCDGVVDNPSEPSQEPSGEIDAECVENPNLQWCLDSAVLVSCMNGVYQESNCSNFGQLCSFESNQCIHSECIGREDSQFCDGNVAVDCTLGQVSLDNCEACEDGECTNGSIEESNEKSGCASGLGLFLPFFGVWGYRGRRRESFFVINLRRLLNRKEYE